MPYANKAEERSGDKQKGYKQKQATQTKKTDTEAILTRPKGRPRRNGNRRFERARKETTRSHSNRARQTLQRKNQSRKSRTPQQARRETATKGGKAARATRKNPKQAVTTIRKKTSRSAGKQHPDNRGITKEKSQHGREQEEGKAKSRRRCRIWKRMRTKTIEN